MIGSGENCRMRLTDVLLGRPLATEEERAERIGPAKGVPIFGLDALSSAAYGPEAALTLLLPLGLAGVAYIVPISISIITCSRSCTSPIARPSWRTRRASGRIRSQAKTS